MIMCASACAHVCACVCVNLGTQAWAHQLLANQEGEGQLMRLKLSRVGGMLARTHAFLVSSGQ